MQRVAVCCNVLQCVAVVNGVILLSYVAEECSEVQCSVVGFNVMQCAAVMNGLILVSFVGCGVVCCSFLQ